MPHAGAASKPHCTGTGPEKALRSAKVRSTALRSSENSVADLPNTDSDPPLDRTPSIDQNLHGPHSDRPPYDQPCCLRITPHLVALMKKKEKPWPEGFFLSLMMIAKGGFGRTHGRLGLGGCHRHQGWGLGWAKRRPGGLGKILDGIVSWLASGQRGWRTRRHGLDGSACSDPSHAVDNQVKLSSTCMHGPCWPAGLLLRVGKTYY